MRNTLRSMKMHSALYVMVIPILAYFAVFVAISLAVSAAARSSRLALVLLLTFWFANGLVASRAVADLASWWHPAPSAVEFQKALEADLGNQQEMQERLERRKRELLAKYNVDSVDALPIAFSGISLQEGEEHGNEVFDRHYGRLFDIYQRQGRVFELGGALAPTLAVRSISMALAGTDLAQHLHFVRAAEDYRRGIQRVMNNAIAERQKPGQTYLAGPELWHEVPDFDYQAPSTAWVLGNVRWPLLLLAGWLGLAWFGLFRAVDAARAE